MELSDYLDRLLPFIPFLLSLSVHEWAHAWMATKLGDDTPRHLGRLTLNPFAHMDMVGTLVLPLMGVPFGWAKPVEFNPIRFTRKVRLSFGIMLTALAGPVSNLILAGLSLTALLCINRIELAHTYLQSYPDLHLWGLVNDALRMLIYVNITLALFNLLPIPPLDGSHIAEAFMPKSFRPYWDRLCSIGPILLLALFIIPMITDINILAWPRSLAERLIDIAVP